MTTVEVPDQSQALAIERAQLDPVLAAWRALDVNTEALRVFANDELVKVKTRIKALETQRTTVTGPLNQVLTTVNGWFRPARESYVALEGVLKDKLWKYRIRNMADIKATMEAPTKTMSLLLGTIAAISLIVGGIGIMNIMLVSVTERTREIGLRKAIGASNKDIMTQFLIEAVTMTFTGGIAGVIFGAGIALLLAIFAGWTIKISVFSILLATIFSIAVGLVFGLWPASQAAKLNPIEALRYE